MQPDYESANRDVRKLFNRYSSMEFKNSLLAVLKPTHTHHHHWQRKKLNSSREDLS